VGSDINKDIPIFTIPHVTSDTLRNSTFTNNTCKNLGERKCESKLYSDYASKRVSSNNVGNKSASFQESPIL